MPFCAILCDNSSREVMVWLTITIKHIFKEIFFKNIDKLMTKLNDNIKEKIINV